jgi:pimeloyl-ACP methyl ester carboxylesterase
VTPVAALPRQADPSPGAVHEGGQGSTLVLLHGLGGTWEVWRPVLSALEARHRVIALTLPGHHGGPRYDLAGDATVYGIADQVIRLLRSRGIAQAHVAGNSLGGWLSLELARRGFARSVVALSPAGGWRTDQDYRAIAVPFRITYAIVGAILWLVTWLARFAAVRAALTRQTMVHGQRMTPREFIDGLRAMARTPILPGLLRSMRRDGPAAPLAPQGVPITIAWAEHDRVVPYPRYGASFRERISGLHESIVPDAGHVPMWDNPREVADQILRVTSAVDAASDAPVLVHDEVA